MLLCVHVIHLPHLYGWSVRLLNARASAQVEILYNNVV